MAESSRDTLLSETICKLQPDRTVYLRGFNSFAAAATIHNASSTGFQVSGTFRDPADFAVAVLYDADNGFEHPSIRYLPDFNFAGLTLNFSLLYSDGVQPIDSPKYNWIDWATLDVVRADGTTANIPLWENATLGSGSFPAAAISINVNATKLQALDRLTLWYENVAFDYTAPGGVQGTATYYWQAAGTTASISVGSTVYTYNVTAAGGEDPATIAAGVAAAASADPQVAFAAGAGIVTFQPKVNTGATVSVSGYPLWLITDPPSAYLANLFVEQINGCDWQAANTTYGLLATLNGTPGTATSFSVTAARYGTVNVSGTSVAWSSGTQFTGLTAGETFLIGGTAFTIAAVQSATQLALTPVSSGSPAPPASGAYVAPRGGRDGNMIQLYSLASSPSTTFFDSAEYQLSGGSSAVTWNVSLNFTALGIDSIRQCWLTFAPSLTCAAYSPTSWLATFSNWQLTEADGGTSVSALQVAGPGSVRLEETSPSCIFSGSWTQQSGFYSKYFANATSVVNDSITITYSCQFTHNLYIGTSLYGISAAAPTVTLVENTQYNPAINGAFYSDRGVAGITVDGDTETLLDCRVNTGSELVARRLLRSALAAGTHTVVIRVAQAGAVYFDFLEAAVLANVPDALTPRPAISAALDFDTNETYMLTPSRLLWTMTKLGYAGPINEYLGVFWWNQRIASGATFSTAQITFGGTFAGGDSIFLTFNPPAGAQLGKSVFADDTLATIASHFAAFINGSLVSAWASASGAVLTITSRSQGSAWDLALSLQVSSAAGTATMSPAQPAPGVAPEWVIDDSATPAINQAVSDWHADFYAQCAAAGLTVVSSCSMELVNPPAGYGAQYPSGSAVATATGFGNLNSTQCAAGASKLLAYQKAVYRNIAQLQAAAGLTPYVQYGEFLWWYFADPAGSGMAYYDAETAAAAKTALGRPLRTFLTPNDNPGVNNSADALFLRDRLRDYVGALVADIREAYPAVRCEVLWPYDVNYPTPVGGTGGQLNRFVNLPVEWQQQPSSGLDSMKVEALSFATSLRDLDLSNQAIRLFPGFGWPLSALRYLVPVFGSADPWERELALVWAAGIPLANLWALDHVCLFNLGVPEAQMERRSVVKTG